MITGTNLPSSRRIRHWVMDDDYKTQSESKKAKRKSRIVLFDFIDWEITLREVLFSILILGVWAFIGFVVYSAIDKKVDDITLKYRQAVSMESPSEFRHAMDTDVGYAFVRGNLEAVTPVTNRLVKGEYLSIHIKHQKYQRHTRRVSYTVHDSKGRPHTKWRTETYWSWDTVRTSTTNSPMVRFCGSEFPYGKFIYDCASSERTVVGGGSFKNERDIVYTTKDGFTATMFGDLRNGSFVGQANLVGASIEKYRKRSERCDSPYIMFWTVWVGVAIFGLLTFYVRDNNWAEG